MENINLIGKRLQNVVLTRQTTVQIPYKEFEFKYFLTDELKEAIKADLKQTYPTLNFDDPASVLNFDCTVTARKYYHEGKPEL